MNDEMNNSHTTEVMMSLLDQGWLYLAANMNSTYVCSLSFLIDFYSLHFTSKVSSAPFAFHCSQAA